MQKAFMRLTGPRHAFPADPIESLIGLTSSKIQDGLATVGADKWRWNLS